MKINKTIDPKLLAHINNLNTLNGGMAQPMMHFGEKEAGYELRVRIPGISPELLHAEVINNRLLVYHMVNPEGELAPGNRIVGQFPINFDIDIPAITAFTEGDTLYVDLPFNQMKGGYRKKLTY